MREFHNQMLNYIHKAWGSEQKTISLVEQKKVIMLLNDLWKHLKEIVKENKLFEGVVVMQKRMLMRYQEEIVSKIESCFTL